MAKPPMTADAAPDDMEDPADAPADTGDAGDAGAEDTEEPGEENVLFTVCKEPDGTYSLIKGDEQDASGMDAAGSADMENPATAKKTFDSPGALLKACLDILNEDEGGEGGGDSQFQAGFDESAPPKPPGMAQKY